MLWLSLHLLGFSAMALVTIGGVRLQGCPPSPAIVVDQGPFAYDRGSVYTGPASRLLVGYLALSLLVALTAVARAIGFGPRTGVPTPGHAIANAALAATVAVWVVGFVGVQRESAMLCDGLGWTWFAVLNAPLLVLALLLNRRR